MPSGGIQSVNPLLEYPYEIVEMPAVWSHDSRINFRSVITPTCPGSSVQGLVLKSQEKLAPGVQRKQPEISQTHSLISTFIGHLVHRIMAS